MKIAVIGAGAVGGATGGYLANKGNDVTLIAKRAHVDAINKNGLQIKSNGAILHINIQAIEKLNFKPDLVFLTVKTQDLEKTCIGIKDFIGDIPIVLVQNGVKADEIAGNIFKKENIIGCIILFNSKYNENGVIEIDNKKQMIIGKPFGGNDETVDWLFNMLKGSFSVKVSDCITNDRWTKLLVNLYSNSLEAITGENISKCTGNKIIREIGIMILKESLEVINKANIKLTSLPEVPISIYRAMIGAPISVSSFFFKLLFSSGQFENVTTSTLQSLKRNKSTEIDYLNGAIVELGKKVNLPTPYNAKVVEIVHSIEKSGIFPKTNELKNIF